MVSAAGKVIAFRPSSALRSRVAAAAAAMDISPGEYARRACEAATRDGRVLLTTGGYDENGAKSALTTARPTGELRTEYDEGGA